jgi:hypothetical protein
MEIVHFLGRISPPGIKITVGYKPKIFLEERPLGFKASFVVHINESIVDVECHLPKFRIEQYNLIRIRAYDKARTAVDLAAFATGASLITVFEEFVYPDGRRELLAPRDESLAKLCTAYKMSEDSFDKIYRLVTADYNLFMALRDLIEANTIPHVDIINCGRVLDAIRRMISPGVADPKQAWGQMQRALNISQAYQQWVTKLSADPRHADRSYISGGDVAEAVKRTWIIMNRLLEYRIRGNVTLQPPDFPHL